MDKTMLRQQALNLVSLRLDQGFSVEDVLKEADKVFAWFIQDEAPTSLGKTEPVPSEPAQHESTAAVVGQEPKGE